MKRLSRRLLKKSQEAFVLGVELFNKPTIRYRLEGFCFFFINAWELMLKARIIETTGTTESIFEAQRQGENGRQRHSISLSVALGKVFPNGNDPVRKNVERLADLRNAAVHLVVPELEPIYGGLIQAGVINYANTLRAWFGLRVTDGMSPGMLSLVFDVHNIDPLFIKQRYGREVLDFVERQQALLQAELAYVTDVQFCIPVTYRLVLTKNPQGADIVLSSGPEGAHSGVVMEIPKDIDRTHPYLQKDVVKLVKERLGEATRFTAHDFQSIVHKEKIKAQNNFHYPITKPRTSRYSESLVEHICHQIRSHPDYLIRARRAYTDHLRVVGKPSKRTMISPRVDAGSQLQ